MIINQSVAQEIHDAWTSDQLHPHRDRDRNRATPDFERLAILIDVLFRASFIPEEGEHVNASVLWASKEEILDREIPKRRSTPLLLEFSEARSLDPLSLAKIGKIADSTNSVLVDWIDGTPKIWGIIYSNRKANLWNEIPTGSFDLRHTTPDCPCIHITGIGSLLISRSGTVIGRIEKGEYRGALPTPFHSRAMGKYLHRFFGIETKLVDGRRLVVNGEEKKIFLNCVEFLLTELDRQGGGATIIFIPQGQLESARRNCDFSWSFTGTLEIDSVISLLQNQRQSEGNYAHASQLSSMLYKRVLADRLCSIARMATLDGAVLLGSSLEVFGFGVKLHAPMWQGKVVEGQDGSGGGGTPIDFTRLGTRHNTSASFVGAIPESIAFVASVDGPIRALVRSTDETILCWPDCRVSMFV